MDGFEIVRQLKARRTAIFEHYMPAEAIAEVEDIDTAIRQIDALFREHGREVEVLVPPQFSGLVDVTVRPKRVPLKDRVEAVYQFLVGHGPATRSEILAHTGIPPGTFSAVLAQPPFVKVADGRWAVEIKNDSPNNVG